MADTFCVRHDNGDNPRLVVIVHTYVVVPYTVHTNIYNIWIYDNHILSKDQYLALGYNIPLQ